MASYDGFSSVSDPHEYMNAPSLIMSDGGLGTAFQPDPAPTPLIVQAAVNYAHDFNILSADELQSFYSERGSLKHQLSDAKERLMVELKMYEAAQSLSKIHAEEASVSSLSPTSPGKIAGSRRLSKLLGGQDSHAKHEKRLSRQAAEEVAISAGKITDLKEIQAELELRLSHVENIILQHHAGVLAKEVSGLTIPTHRRNRSDASTISVGAPMSPPPSSGRTSIIAGGLSTPRSTANPQRQSWLMSTAKHQRQPSANSILETQSLPPVSELRSPRRSHIQHSPQQPRSVIDNTPKVNADEIDLLVQQISQLQPQFVPSNNPTPQNQLAFIYDTFKTVSEELSRSQYELRNSVMKANKLQSELDKVKLNLNNVQKEHEEVKMRAASQQSKDIPFDLSKERERELQYQIEAEHSTTLKWRDRAERQRVQLLQTTKALEDVTKLAVEFEGERNKYQQTLGELDKKISSLEAEKSDLLKYRLSSSGNSSLLCKEFQQIIDELIRKHHAEMRNLYPKFKEIKDNRSSTGSMSMNEGKSINSEHDTAASSTKKHNKSASNSVNELRQEQPLRTLQSKESETSKDVNTKEKVTSNNNSSKQLDNDKLDKAEDQPDSALAGKKNQSPGEYKHLSKTSVSSGDIPTKKDIEKGTKTNDEGPAYNEQKNKQPSNTGSMKGVDSPRTDTDHISLNSNSYSETPKLSYGLNQTTQPLSTKKLNIANGSPILPQSESMEYTSRDSSREHLKVQNPDTVLPLQTKHSKKPSESTIKESQYTQVPPSTERFGSHESLESNRDIRSHSARNSIDERDDFHGDLVPPSRMSPARFDDTTNDSIQHTSESLMMPPLTRNDSEFSEYSKSSSYYPDNASSKNGSSTSFAAQNAIRAAQQNQFSTSDRHIATKSNVHEQSFDFDNDDDDELL